jgi:hypothetical protein
MTIIEFPIGYFYIISQLNGLVLDVFDGENGQVRKKGGNVEVERGLIMSFME